MDRDARSPNLLSSLVAVSAARQPTVEAGSLELLPAALVREKVVREPDKPAIRAALERGEQPGGARLVPGTFRLSVR